MRMGIGLFDVLFWVNPARLVIATGFRSLLISNKKTRDHTDGPRARLAARWGHVLTCIIEVSEIDGQLFEPLATTRIRCIGHNQ